MSKAPKSENDWEAESDANTLAQAKAIGGDKSRLKRAQTAAGRMADEQMAKASELRRLAKAKRSKAPARTRRGKRK
ncbi:MAG: hypothetical protein KAU28_01170 [Phycisphaerae bacterium]|nr:hypothetical protein [Phycisphaerae bacterium]